MLTVLDPSNVVAWPMGFGRKSSPMRASASRRRLTVFAPMASVVMSSCSLMADRSSTQKMWSSDRASRALARTGSSSTGA